MIFSLTLIVRNKLWIDYTIEGHLATLSSLELNHSLTAQTLMSCRQDLHHLVRPNPQGDHHGGRVSEGHLVKQVWPLREVHEQASGEVASPWDRELRRREMGKTQKDPEPCIPSRKAQGTVLKLASSCHKLLQAFSFRLSVLQSA